MRIGISINGEGKGHVTRMIALSRYLTEKHELFFWAPDSIAPILQKALPDALIMPVPLLKIVMNQLKIDIIRTSIDNFPHIVQTPATVKQMSDQMQLLRLDGLLSDFEPYSTWAARIAALPILQLNHPGVVLKALSLMPDAVVSKVVASSMIGDYDEMIISSFYGGDVGPILRKEILQAKTHSRAGEHIVVYVRDFMREQVVSALRSATNREIRLFPSEEHDFIESFASCAGIVASAGHQMSSEALYLKKPILSIPIEGQFEQRLNAIMINRSGRGIYGRVETMENDSRYFFRELPSITERCGEPAPEGYCFDDQGARAAFLTEQFFRTGGLPLAKKA